MMGSATSVGVRKKVILKIKMKNSQNTFAPVVINYYSKEKYQN
tara:strand:+ start:789 stop:917 length:129 start_codon:yes stop_codon:yes gene_type:complete